MENQEADQITEEQRKRAEANRAAALAKRKAILSLTEQPAHEKGQNWNLYKCRKLSPHANIPVAKQPLTSDSSGPPEKLRVRLEICSPDSFSVTPVAIEGFAFLGEDACFEKLRDCFLNVCWSSRFLKRLISEILSVIFFFFASSLEIWIGLIRGYGRNDSVLRDLLIVLF